MANKYYDIKNKLSIPELASRRNSELSRRERESDTGRRVIGGDLGDLEFYGYTLNESRDETVLDGPVLVTSLKKKLTKDEAYEIALGILMASYNSIGVDAVERS